MTKTWPQLLALDDDPKRLRLIRWLGPLRRDAQAQGQLHIDAIVARLASEQKPASYPRSGHLEGEEVISFGIGDLPDLSTSSYYLKGRASSATPLKRETLRLNFATQAQLRLRDKVNGSYPMRVFEVAERTHWNQIYDCSITRVEHDDDPCGVLFPAMEILRFAYGSSSAMLQAVTDGTLKDVLREVDEHSRMEGGVHVIHLPAGFQPEDAATFSWLLQDDYARDSALHVHPSIAANMNRRSYPQPRLPYTGTRDLSVVGRFVTGEDGKTRFLVHHILKIDISLQWLVGIAARAGDADPSISAEGQHRSGRLPDADPRRSTLDSSTAPGHGTALARLPALPSQFSSIKPMKVKVPTLSATRAIPVGGEISSPETPWGTISTDPGYEQGARARRGTLAVATPDRAAPIQADFSAIRRIVALLAKRGWHTRECPSPATFPGTTEPALIVEVGRQGRFSYLVERERIGGRSSGPLIVASLGNCRKAAETELEALLALRSGSRTWPQFDPAHRWRLARVNHAYASDETFRDAILANVCT